MKPKTARMLFLLTMVAAGTAATAVRTSLAAEPGARAYADRAQGKAPGAGDEDIQEAPEMRIEGKALIPLVVIDRVSSLLKKLNPMPKSAADLDRDWRLNLLQSEPPKSAGGENPRTSGAVVGVSMRMNF